MIYGLIGLGIIVVILGVMLFKKQHLDKSELGKLQTQIVTLGYERNRLEDELEQKSDAIKQAEDNYRIAVQRCIDDLKVQKQQLAESLESSKKELAAKLDTEKTKAQYSLEEYKKNIENKKSILDEDLREKERMIGNEIEVIDYKLFRRQEEYQSLLQPFKVLEKEKHSTLFYCIQLSKEDINDIDFLLNEVARHVNNKDVIPKLVWSNYIQSPVQELMKRAEIKDEPGIYKITNVSNGKAYIGKSTKIKSRLCDHIKSSIGISTIADQRFHHIMLEEGLWNFTFEKICYCSKEELNEKEKYYIEFFDTTNYGYNIKAGG